jgi:predicted DNA binding CopG/RHH family protein
MANKKKLGKKNLLPAKIEPKDVKVLISIRLSEELLDFYKRLANEKGIGYQALIQQALHEKMTEGTLSDRLEKLEQKIPALERALLKTG